MPGKSYTVISAMFYRSYRTALLRRGDDLARAQIPGGGIAGSRLGGWLPGSQADPGVPGDTGGQDPALRWLRSPDLPLGPASWERGG